MTTAGLALGASRTACYLAVALVLGGLAFVVLAWRPALRSVRPTAALGVAAAAFTRRAAGFALIGCGLGAAGTAGLLIAAPRPAVSTSWLLVELASWLAVGAWIRRTGWPGERGGHATGPLTAGLALATLALVLAGEPPTVALGGLSILHVTAAGVWVGGVVYLAAALPAALGHLDPARQTDLLAASLARFSPLALGSVVAILFTGTVHTALLLPRASAAWDTSFGRLVVVKVLLVGLLVALGAVNRQRVIPALADRGSRPRDAWRAVVLARRALAGEVLAMAVVLAMTAALVAAAPSLNNPSPYAYGHVDSRRSAP